MNEPLSPVAEAIPEQAICREALLEKYAKDKEQTARTSGPALARALAGRGRGQARPLGAAFPRGDGSRLHSSGRINSAAGIPMQATLINCFVQPVGDSISEVVDGRPGIYNRIAGSREDHAARRRRRLRLLRHPPQGGGSEGHALARERTRVVHARLRPVLRDGGVRGQPPRRADGVLRCDHPDVEEFIHAKDQGDLANFNISVGVTDAFMQAVENDAEIELAHKARAARGCDRLRCLQRGDGLWVYAKPRGRASCGTRS